MANYTSLKATIDANIKQNGNEEITGPVLNSVLNTAVDSLGAGFLCMGRATPSTNPGTPDQNVCYIAGPGTYTRFGDLVVEDNEVALLVWSGSWTKVVTGAAPSAAVRTSVIASATTTYNKETGDVFIGLLSVRNLASDRVEYHTINSTFSALPSGVTAFVLTAEGAIEVKKYPTPTSPTTTITDTDIVLLTYIKSQKVFTGGALYADYIGKTADLNGAYFSGKKLVANGDSIMYGATVSDRDAVFPVLAAKSLGMSCVNYAISGTVAARRASDYEGVFLDYSAWQAAVAAGTLDTSKKYLVKDNLVVPSRPYHIYSYTDGNWTPGGIPSYMVGRTPLVDRIAEMDTDADVVLICVGSNDWAYEWTPFGDDSSRDVTDYTGALHRICQYLADTYPGKLVLFITPPFSWRYQPQGVSQATWNITTWDATSPNLRKSWWDYLERQREVLKQYGFPLFDIGSELGFSQQNRWWSGDSNGSYVHPSAAAQPEIAEALCAKLHTLRKLL